MLHNLIKYFKGYGVDPNTTATIFITVIVFGLGLFISWVGRKSEKRNQRKLYKKSLLHLLRDFSSSCSKLTRAVNTSLSSAGLTDGKDFHINYVPIGTLEYLNKLDFAVLIQNLREPLYSRTFLVRRLPIIKRRLCVKRDYSKVISKMIELFTQGKIQNEQIISINKMYFDAFTLHQRNFYSNVDNLRKLHDSLVTKLNGVQVERSLAEFVYGFSTIFKEWQDGGGQTDPRTEHTQLILKILAHNRLFPQLELILEANNYALAADNAFQNIVKIDGLLFKLFRDYIYFHRRASKMVNVIIEILA